MELRINRVRINRARPVVTIFLHREEKVITQQVLLKHSGFPPIREIRENFEDFFQFFSQENQGKMGFSAKIKEKISNQELFFPKPFSNLLNL